MLSSARPCESGSPPHPGIDGMSITATANATIPSCTSRERRSSSRRPPTIFAKPSTSRMFETTEPVIEPRTTSGSPSRTASSAMINSGALPTLAFRNPPTPAPVCSAACSVDSPISHASGTSAAAATTNRTTSPASVAKRRTITAGASASSAKRILRPTGDYPTRRVPGAVLFDWSNTLVRFTWDDELLEEGHRAGLEALAREDEADAFTARFRDTVLPRMTPADDYGDLLRGLLGPLTDEQVDRFVDAEHEAWGPAHALLGTAHALLEALRERGLKTAVVANAWPEPGRVLRRDLAELGISDRLDAAVFSTDVGVRKPDPRIFLHAVETLGVDPLDALFVGDRLVEDVQGAAEVGMTTVQSLWFSADDTPATVEPDFLAFTPMDVLNAVARLAS